MDKTIDYLEKEYGIKVNERYYSVLFKIEDTKETIRVKGEILNFHPSQVILKSEKGLYIIKPRNIVEMRPINNKTKKTELTIEKYNLKNTTCLCEKCAKELEVRGIKRIECFSCGKEAFTNVAYGMFCYDCCKKRNICIKCGKDLQDK